MTLYVPAPLVTALFVTPVASLVMDTLAFGTTAPLASVTVPEMPATACADAVGPNVRQARTAPRHSQSATFDLRKGKASNPDFMCVSLLKTRLCSCSGI